MLSAPSVKCVDQLALLITKPTPQFHSRNTQLPFPTFPSTNLSFSSPPFMLTHRSQQSDYYVVSWQTQLVLIKSFVPDYCVDYKYWGVLMSSVKCRDQCALLITKPTP
jgi:hypothetical protein